MGPETFESNDHKDTQDAEKPGRVHKGESVVATRTVDSGRSAAGTVIGSYRLLELIGEGGMGEVWLAEQKQPVRRRVALKLIKAGMDTRDVVARFESERQALALMDHPAIAKVFDAGSTPDGRPYFAMEYVPGLPITTYCDKHKLATRERLELFIHVCEGGQHAHQKAIIHRDLKPSNILVSEVDGEPMPRIIDFGVAKATAQRLTAETMYTQLGAIIGTLGYMSPEQADSAGQDIDTRSDVYSLGVVLYELLVGVLPLDFRKVAFDQALRQLREKDAPKPSTKLRTLGGEWAITAQNRRSEPPALVRQLQGDPDAIALKALEKDRTRRYATPSDLAADIGRYLRNEPVLARPASAAYRARKYIRRHRVGVAVAGAGLAALVAFAVAQAIELRRITKERDRADRAEQFMTDMFKVVDPRQSRGKKVTAQEVLDKASKNIDTSLSNDPVLQAHLMQRMGITYTELGLYSQAQSLLERAVDIQRRVLGPQSRETLYSSFNLAVVLANEGHLQRADNLYRDTLDAQRRVLGPENPDTLFTMNNLAHNLSDQGHFAEAETMQREVIRLRTHALGPEERHTLSSMTELADILNQERREADAETVCRQALEIQQRVLGPDHPDTLATMSLLGNALEGEVKYAEAEKIQRETVDLKRRVLGAEHPETLITMDNLAVTLQAENRNTEAEQLEREVLDIRRRVLGPENPDTLISMNNLASVLMNEKHWPEAEKLSRETLDIDRRTLGPEHPYTLFSMANVATDLSQEGHYSEGQAMFRDAIQIASKTNQPGVIDTLWYYFGSMAATAGHRDEALEYLGNAIDHGFKNVDAMQSDSDLKSLHGDPRFAALIARAKSNDATAAKSH
jgi:eukaryotic-like serine/threonine-protein kinase